MMLIIFICPLVQKAHSQHRAISGPTAAAAQPCEHQSALALKSHRVLFPRGAVPLHLHIISSCRKKPLTKPTNCNAGATHLVPIVTFLVISGKAFYKCLFFNYTVIIIFNKLI
ncbi:hypothetical protein XELAEV_18023001mg [Xenopus laevis]|uniref:Secreted protein n=1 Tax=Xenopus laevis TaxID=8355 RepID=A0A974HP72_XENLA|nr:hypothetical protein XELAEV_18023001mg [Xenopus laevis]